MSIVRVRAFDHLVLNVEDVERSLAFYSTTLGLETMRVDEWRAGRAGFPSVRISPDTIIDLVQGHRGESNVDHICLVVDPVNWQDVIEAGVFTVLEGPVSRSGARGEGISLYVQDPDRNTVELRWYPADAAPTPPSP
ncbi:VOC family protein [Micromonospora sp. NPDC049374]|uniref:VOC family protein n=1 Tax=Micromonospora sp. NPDC049374 TaxID=3154352 RepID=UPI003447F07C